MEDEYTIITKEDLILWCRFLSELEMPSWAQLSACGGWGITGLRLALAEETPSVYMYFGGLARHISEPLSVNPSEAPQLRPALLRLLRRPAIRSWPVEGRIECLSWPPPPDPRADTWIGWLLDNGFSPAVRMGVDDYGRTAWLEWHHQDGRTLHQAGADEPAAGMWFVVGGDPEACFMTPDDAAAAAYAAHDKEDAS